MYIKRQIENTLEKAFAAFPAILVTGPRQVGKSTLLLNKFSNITKKDVFSTPLLFPLSFLELF